MEADLSLAPHRASFIEKIRGKRSCRVIFFLRRLRAGNQEDVGSFLDATRIMPRDGDAVNNLLRRMI
jgi:hypothetical protein